MAFRLNPDGSKIRALRIQRGWTQEQLAEIAGVSARTIQRAESAGCAAFETLRAVAGAFEADFRDLLKSDSPQVSDLELQFTPPPATPAASIFETCEAVSPSHPGRQARGVWKALLTAVAALAAGFLAGGILVYRLTTPVGVHISTARQNPVVLARDDAGSVIHHAEASTLQAAGAPRRVAKPTIRKAGTRAKSRPVVDKSEDQNPVWQTAEIFQPSVLSSQATILPSQKSTSPELPLQPKGLTTIPAISWMSGAQSPLVAPDSLKDDPGVGAVRGAMGLAAKKTGDAFVKVGTSMKRAF
jgi:transcriptional regulator with XRE-family HTH domain